jgi:predicted nucleic acid-binding protein
VGGTPAMKRRLLPEPEEGPLTRYVIDSDVALALARDQAPVSDQHQLLAPALIRSQVLATLYQKVRDGELAKKEADRQLTYVRALRMRLLGDRVLQTLAWKIAEELGLPDTFDAEYIALTQLQADAYVTLDARLAGAVAGLVRVATIEELRRPPGTP